MRQLLLNILLLFALRKEKIIFENKLINNSICCFFLFLLLYVWFLKAVPLYIFSVKTVWPPKAGDKGNVGTIYTGQDLWRVRWTPGAAIIVNNWTNLPY